MSTTVEAVYEQGALRLMQPTALAEGARVQVIIMTPKPATERKSPADILAAIAALPLEGMTRDRLNPFASGSTTTQ